MPQSIDTGSPLGEQSCARPTPAARRADRSSAATTRSAPPLDGRRCRGSWALLVCVALFSLALAACQDADESKLGESGDETSATDESDDEAEASDDETAETEHPPLELDDRPAPNPSKKVDFGDGRPVTLADLVDRLQPGVVNIYTTNLGATASGRQQFRPFDDFDQHGVPPSILSQALGTGFLIDEEGYILTNNHVIESASRIKVRLYDDQESTAEIVGTDPRTDIALIRMTDPPKNLQPLALGDASDLRVGDWVVAIGNPLGLAHTVTAGIVSARGRSNIPLGGRIGYMDFIQTDASINPGNSGGPLLNLAGEVVGINTAISRHGQGIGFAIPIDMARDILPQLITSGRVVRSFIGLQPKDVPLDVAERYGLDVGKGALVDRIVRGGPAHQAGIREDDIVLEFDGQEVDSTHDLRWLAQTAGVGRTVKLEILRDGERMTLEILTEELPDE